MSYNRRKLLIELHKKYYFIESHTDRIRNIIFDSIPDDATYEEALRIGNENIIKNIIYRINNRLFPRLFNRTVKRMGIERTFDFYNTIIQTTGHEIHPYDLLKICANSKYDAFLKNAESNGNKLLEDVLDMYNSDADINISWNHISHEVKEYLSWIKNFSLLKSKEEEAALIRKYKETGNKEYKDQFINSNLRLVVNIVLKKYSTKPNIKLDLQDLIQAGNIGLIKAYEKFDENKGFKFSTYATWWIKSEIDNLIFREGDTIRIPQETIIKINKMQIFRDEYLAKYGVEASEEDIRNYLKVTEETYNEIKLADARRKTLSYDVRIHDGYELFDEVDFSELSKQTEEMEYTSTEEEPIIKLPVSSDILEEISLDDELYLSIMDLIPDNESTSVEEEAIKKYLTQQMLTFTLNTLKPNEIRIMLEECGFNKEGYSKMQIEIGKELGVSHERIRQIEASALQKLQSHAYRINNGIPVEQEFFSLKDIKKELKRKRIKNIRILSHHIYNKNTRFKCKECGNEFKENTSVFIKNPECPFCSEENKQLIKK